MDGVKANCYVRRVLECKIEDGLAGKAESNIAVYKSLVLTGRGKPLNRGKRFKGRQFPWTLLASRKISKYSQRLKAVLQIIFNPSSILDYILGHSFD